MQFSRGECLRIAVIITRRTIMRHAGAENYCSAWACAGHTVALLYGRFATSLRHVPAGVRCRITAHELAAVTALRAAGVSEKKSGKILSCLEMIIPRAGGKSLFRARIAAIVHGREYGVIQSVARNRVGTRHPREIRMTGSAWMVTRRERSSCAQSTCDRRVLRRVLVFLIAATRNADLFPNAVGLPLAIVAVDGPPVREIVRQHPPCAAASLAVQDGVDHRAD